MNPPDGVIEGNWEYIIAAYSVTWVFLLGYAVSLWTRRKKVVTHDR